MGKIATYVKESRQEMGKVLWPSRKDLITHAGLVIGASLALAAFIGAADYVFTLGLEQFLTLR